jgi:hypothetical protein
MSLTCKNSLLNIFFAHCLSFFFKGLTGLTLTVGGIVTLGVLMALTAKVDWSQKLGAVSPRLA